MTIRPSTSRPRDAEATRRALLDAARSLFASEGYDATTVRAVADKAGVNQALLFRYFGNKEGLFVAAVRGRALGLLAEVPREQLLEHVLRAVLAPDVDDSFLASVRGSGSTQIGERLRAEVGDAYRDAIADLVEGPDGREPDRADARLRAELLLTWLFGLTAARPLLNGLRAPVDTALPHLLRAARALLNG